jgi:hypothetical protein
VSVNPTVHGHPNVSLSPHPSDSTMLKFAVMFGLQAKMGRVRADDRQLRILVVQGKSPSPGQEKSLQDDPDQLNHEYSN